MKNSQINMVSICRTDCIIILSSGADKDSFVKRLKDAREKSSNPADALKRSTSVICATGTNYFFLGCTLHVIKKVALRVPKRRKKYQKYLLMQSFSASISCPPCNEWHFTGSGYICNSGIYNVWCLIYRGHQGALNLKTIHNHDRTPTFCVTWMHQSWTLNITHMIKL